MTHVPFTTYEDIEKLLGDEDELKQKHDENTTVVYKRTDEGFQQIITTKEWVSDKVGKRTTTAVRNYFPAVEEEEEVEENVEEEVVDEEKLAELRSKAPPMPTNLEPEYVVGKDGKKKKKKQKLEGNAEVVREAFEGGYKEITTVRFPDGTHKSSTKMFYDPVEVPQSEQQVVEETQTTKSGKKKKVKKVVNLNQEILEEYEEDDGSHVTVAREAFPDGTGHKDITTIKKKNGESQTTFQIVFYPKEKEIIETTEIIEHEASSTRLSVKETVIKANRETEETEEHTTTKKSSKKTSKTAKVEKHNVEDQEQHVVQFQQLQAVEDSGMETIKKTKKTTKKLTEDNAQQAREALMARDNSEGVTTVRREKTDKGYREIATTVFPDGSTKTQTREFFDAVEETVDPQQAMAMREELAVLAQQPPRVTTNADGSVSTIVVTRIDNGYRQTTTTKKLNGATSVQTREFYDPVEEGSEDQTRRRIGVSKQQIQGVQNNYIKSVKLFG